MFMATFFIIGAHNEITNPKKWQQHQKANTNHPIPSSLLSNAYIHQVVQPTQNMLVGWNVKP